MRNSRIFSEVTAEALARIKGVGRTQYSVVFDPPEGPHSIATSQTPFGKCVVEFEYDITRAELTLKIVEKPWMVPESLLWSVFGETLDRCRQSG
jgi:hypothetical protein